MEAGGTLPSRGPAVRAEVVHESGRTRVTRLFLAERTVIRKEPLGPDAEHRLRHETAILERLRGVAGVAQVAGSPRYPGSIVLEGTEGTSLALSRTPLAPADLIGLAAGLAQVVAGMHRRGVIHRDITPANIVLSRDGSPCLVDFALATLLAEMRPEFTHHTEIAGTLAYLAPEQTGRTGRAVDQRADLYALGATLYELATGAPPFGTGDPLRLIHDHLARVPAPPGDVNPAVPAPLSGIIMHLLEKEPDNRYQTADGVIYDLKRSRDARTPPESPGLRVGAHDVPLRLLPPSRLVGRDDQVAALGAAFEEALASRCRGVLVSGAPGVGKTALIDQLRPVVTGKDGWFLAGKFDQYRRDLEFDAGHQAFRALGRLLLAEPEDELVRLREQTLTAVGANAGLLTAVLPEFAALLAVPPDPGDPLAASRARVVATADQTRRRIERDLHDGAQQRLVSLALHLRAAQAAARLEPGELDAQLDSAVAEVTGALEELRETARGIHPAILAMGGLRPALRTLARRSAIPVDLRVHGNGRLPEPVEISAYYVAAEALTNVAKHARASSVSVEVEVAGEVLRIAVRDDGCGGADFTGGTGLVGLKDRVEAIGGRIFLDSPHGAGTSLRVALPITPTNDGATLPDVGLPARQSRPGSPPWSDS